MVIAGLSLILITLIAPELCVLTFKNVPGGLSLCFTYYLIFQSLSSFLPSPSDRMKLLDKIPGNSKTYPAKTEKAFLTRQVNE